MPASYKVRSLNFPHGLIQVSSRTTGVSAPVQGVAGLANAARQLSVEPGFFDLGLSLLAFCDDRAQADAPSPEENRSAGDAYTAATKLLNFASGLTRPFRIVSTVTILQQAFTCFYGDRSAPRASTSASYNEAIGNHACPSPAKQLSKCWRFFRTYTLAETSSVLRHSPLGTSWGSVITNAGFDACRAAHG